MKKVKYFIVPLTFFFIGLNLFLVLIPGFILGAIKKLLPSLKIPVSKIMDCFYSFAVCVDDFILFKVLNNKIKIEKKSTFEDPPYQGNYIAISNHQSWADVFIIQNILNKKIPPPKFLVKKEVVYIPFAGLVALLFDFPLLKRKGHKEKSEKEGSNFDSKTIEQFVLKNKNLSNTFFIFPEGTRYKPKKHLEQNPPFKNQLIPKAGGLWTMLNINHQYDGIFVITINYNHPKKVFYDFFSGGLSNIQVHLDFKKNINFKNYQECKNWLNDVWEKNDSLIKKE